MADLHHSRFDGLDPATLYAILHLRAAVFVVEQECAYLDPDGRDIEPTTVHSWLRSGDTVVAAMRWLQDGSAGRIGRIVTSLGFRRRGFGARLVEDAVAMSSGPVVLDAQSYLTGWYETLGFERDGADFVEDGIPHTPMRLDRSGPVAHRR